MKINLQEGHWTYQTMEVIKIMGSGYCVLWPKTQSGLEITAKQFEVCTPPELQANIINWPTLQRQRLLSPNGVHCPFSVCYITKIYPVMHCLTSSEFNRLLFLIDYDLQFLPGRWIPLWLALCSVRHRGSCGYPGPTGPAWGSHGWSGPFL